MLMTVDRDELLRAVGLVAGIPKASEIPILTQLVLTANGKGGMVRGTDMDIDVTAPFAAEVKEIGELCVNAKLFMNIVKRLPAKQPLSLTWVNGRLKIVCGRSRFELATLPTEDYPPFASEHSDAVWEFEVEADVFARLLTAVRHCQSREETRYYLGGIYLHVTEEEPAKLKAVATNGHTLALDSMAAPGGAYGMPSIIVPSATVSEMLKILPENAQAVTVTVSKRFIWLDRSDGLSMGSKLIDGTYPDYARVIPRSYADCIKVDADGLAAAVSRVATICDSEHAAVSISVDRKGALNILTERAGIGVGRDRLEAVEVEGKKALLTFNYKYLAALLSSYAGGEIELRYDTADGPTLWTLAGSDAGLQVLMPMRSALSAATMAEAA